MPSGVAASDRLYRGREHVLATGLPASQTSLAWRNCQMALPLNRDGIQTVAPASHSWLGRVTIKDRPDSQEEVSVHVDQQAQGFAAAFKRHKPHGFVADTGRACQQGGFEPVLAANGSACAKHHFLRSLMQGGDQLRQIFIGRILANGNHPIVHAHAV